jgi:hypothetical protein
MADEQNTAAAAGAGAADAGAAAAAGAGTAQAARSAVADNASPEPWWASADLKLEDDVKTFWSQKAAPDLATALKTGMHASKLVGERNVLEVPNPNDMANWKGWEVLGWTPDAAKYTVDLPETAKDMGDLAEGYKGFHDHLVKQFHSQRVPLNAAKALASEIVAYNVAQLREADAAIIREKQELEGGLRREWGQSYDANKEMARRAMQTMGLGEEDAAELDALVSSPRMVKLFHKIGAQLGEDRLVTAKGAAGSSVEDARAKKAALEADPAKRQALFDPSHPHHALIKSEREALQNIINAAA